MGKGACGGGGGGGRGQGRGRAEGGSWRQRGLYRVAFRRRLLPPWSPLSSKDARLAHLGDPWKDKPPSQGGARSEAPKKGPRPLLMDNATIAPASSTGLVAVREKAVAPSRALTGTSLVAARTGMVVPPPPLPLPPRGAARHQPRRAPLRRRVAGPPGSGRERPTRVAVEGKGKHRLPHKCPPPPPCLSGSQRNPPGRCSLPFIPHPVSARLQRRPHLPSLESKRVPSTATARPPHRRTSARHLRLLCAPPTPPPPKAVDAGVAARGASGAGNGLVETTDSGG